jgi:hypothetical protein
MRGQLNGTLLLAGDHDFTFDDALIGALTAQGTGTLTLAGVNNLSLLDIQSGTLRIDTDRPVSSGQPFEMRDGTLLECAGAHSCSASLLIDGRVTYGGTGFLTLQRIVGSLDDKLIVDTAGELRTLDGSQNGLLDVERGTFVCDSAGGFILWGTVNVGDGTGSAGSAILRNLRSEQINPFTSVRVREDGLLDLQGAMETVDRLQLNGGRATGTVVKTEVGIFAEPSVQTALVEADWATLQSPTLSAADGAPAVDLEFTGDVLAPFQDRLTKVGAGTVRFSGGVLGADQMDLLILEGSVIVETTDPSPGLAEVTVNDGTTLAVGTANQLGSGCFPEHRGGSDVGPLGGPANRRPRLQRRKHRRHRGWPGDRDPGCGIRGQRPELEHGLGSHPPECGDAVPRVRGRGARDSLCGRRGRQRSLARRSG